jgi:triosephosphate isomerase
MSKKIIVANWKMNHDFADVDTWLDYFFTKFSEEKNSFLEREIILCPPIFMIDYIDSEMMEDGLRKLDNIIHKSGKDINDFSEQELNKIIQDEKIIKLGGQDCHFEQSGSFTGDISALMLKKIGCKYVILGHSERRVGHFESDEIIAKKTKAALSQNLIPIICVGENLQTRQENNHLQFVYQQVIKTIGENENIEKIIIAYEPIWSIGTGVVPSNQQIDEMVKLIKRIFQEKFPQLLSKLSILYGGSVVAENAKQILEITDGLLVGKASLNAEEFFKIIK